MSKKRGISAEEEDLLMSTPLSEPEKKMKDKGTLTLFLLMIPSLLIAMCAAITDTTVRIMFQVVLMFLQIVLLKNLLDQYYEYY